MKASVSIPDQVFHEAEELARRAGESRSRLYSRAIAEYIAHHSPGRVTEAMDRTLADLDEQGSRFAVAASHRVLAHSEW